jgi:hypothetical protein
VANREQPIGPVADFCAELDALHRKSGLSRTAVVGRVNYSRAQIHTILNGQIRRPPDWSSFVEPLVVLCTNGSETAVAEWRRRHSQLVVAHEAVTRQQRQIKLAAAGTVRPAPMQMPADLPGFTGRHTELLELDRALAGTPPNPAGRPGPGNGKAAVFAIVGPPGSGKTALAVRWARQASDRFPDGQLYVDLCGDDAVTALRPIDALNRLLAALGAPVSGRPLDPADAARRYRRRLAGRRVLVVLDNAADSDQVLPLLPEVPGCGVVVTSREPLSGLADRPDTCQLGLAAPPVEPTPPAAPPRRRADQLRRAAGLIVCAAGIILVALVLGRGVGSHVADLAAGIALAAAGLAIPRWSERPTGLDLDSVERQLASYQTGLAESVIRQDNADAQAEPSDRLLPLRWTAAPAALRDELPRSRVRAGGRPPAADSDLAGDWDGVADYVNRLSRVVFLGGSGSGKTILVRHLARQLLSPRGSGNPVPIIVRLASWNPSLQGLYEWISLEVAGSRKVFTTAAATRLGRSLQDLDPRGSRLKRLPPGARLVYELLDRQRILPVLDGLDEMSDGLRPRAIGRLNEELPAAGRVVITCRTAKYQHAITAPTSDSLGELAGTVFDGAAVVVLRAPGPADIGRYLTTAEPGPKWNGLVRELTGNPRGELSAALSTPLMVWLTRKIYARRATGPDGTTPDSLVELAGRGADDVKRHLLSQFIPAVYQDSRWRRKAAKWLAFLARYLEGAERPADGIAWWRLGGAARPIGLLVGIDGALLTVLTLAPGMSRVFGRIPGVAAAVLIGLVFGVLCGRSELQPTDMEIQIRERLGASLRGGLVVAALSGTIIGIAAHRVSLGVLGGLVFGVLLAFAYMHTARVDTERAVDPMSLLHRDRAFAATYLTIYGIPSGFVGALIYDVPFGLLFGATVGALGGLSNGIQYAFTFGFDRVGAVAWGRFQIARAWLAITRRLPWRLMAFLAEARELGVLRQEGGTYHFRHDELREQLAWWKPDDD